MGLFDEIKRLANPYDDELEEDYVEEEEEEVVEPTQRRNRNRGEAGGSMSDTRRQSKIVNMHADNQMQMVIMNPDRFETAAEIADHLRERRAVVLNLEGTDKAIARRLLDFLAGVTYAQEGKIKKAATATYVITPCNVDIMGDLMDELESSGMY